MATPAQSTSASPSGDAAPSAKKWPVDIVALAVLTGNLWAVTAAWHIFNGQRLLASPLRSESDAWLLALTGLIFAYFALLKIVAAWSFILGVPTSLLAVHVAFRKHRFARRWAIAGAVTAVLFVALGQSGLVRLRPYPTEKVEVKPPLFPAAGRPNTLHDLDANLPPVSLTKLSEAEVMAALEKAARARCVVPIDPDLRAACAAQSEAQRWDEETNRIR